MSTASSYPTLPPGRICALIALIDKSDEMLSRAGKAAARGLVFCGLHRFDTTQPVQASKAGLASHSGGYGVRTIFRGLNELEQRGFIQRHSQPARGRDGSWAVSPIGFTEKFFTMLNPGKKNVSVDPSDRKSLKPEYTDVVKQSFRDQPGSASDSHKCEQRQGKTIAQDLLPLVDEMRINPTGVLSLMKKSREKGHRLSNVLQCALLHLRKLRLQGGRAYAYVNKMIGQNVDYAWLAKSAGDEAVRREVQQGRREAVVTELPKLDGRRFKSISNGTIFSVKGGFAHSSVGVLPLNQIELPKFIQAIRDRHLVECS